MTNATELNTEVTETPVEIEMKLSPEEVSSLVNFHKEAQELVSIIGQTEVRKQRLIVQLGGIEDRAQQVMNGAGARLKIPAGTPWQMSQDGTVVILDPKTGQPVTTVTQPSASPPVIQP